MPRQAHLRRLLQDYTPADATEDAHKLRILRLIEGTARPFSRDQYEPGHITTSAFIVSPDTQALLLILHSKLQRWLQPGGHVEPEDLDVLGSARREVVEETGLTQIELATSGLFDVDVHAIPARKDQPAHQHFDLRFLFTAQDLEVSAGSDANAARWVPIAELLSHQPDSEYPTDDSVLRAVRKLPGVRYGAQ
jgi:8-oxo-dGTP pyrophosphatase MutT (NUDIX family)